jgi:hypothetical protein
MRSPRPEVPDAGSEALAASEQALIASPIAMPRRAAKNATSDRRQLLERAARPVSLTIGPPPRGRRDDLLRARRGARSPRRRTCLLTAAPCARTIAYPRLSVASGDSACRRALMWSSAARRRSRRSRGVPRSRSPRRTTRPVALDERPDGQPEPGACALVTEALARRPGRRGALTRSASMRGCLRRGRRAACPARARRRRRPVRCRRRRRARRAVAKGRSKLRRG